MDTTDIPASKAPRDQRPDSCLHCVLMTALEQWFERHGERQDGKVVLNALTAIEKLQECVADVIEICGDRSQRRRAARYAHDALDGCLKAARTGKLVVVDVPAEH